jgi:hypothetical protein
MCYRGKEEEEERDAKIVVGVFYRTGGGAGAKGAALFISVIGGEYSLVLAAFEPAAASQSPI